MLYFDADSIIYSCQEGQESLPLGDYLGEFTDELKDGDLIVEFVSAGPNNYGYRTARGKVECKARGFSLNTRGREQLNFKLLKENIIHDVSDPLTDLREILVFNPHKSTRDVNIKQLNKLTEIKRYKLHWSLTNWLWTRRITFRTLTDTYAPMRKRKKCYES